MGQRDSHVIRQNRAVICKTKRETSGEMIPTSTLILAFYPAELGKSAFLFLNQPGCCTLLCQPRQICTVLHEKNLVCPVSGHVCDT